MVRAFFLYRGQSPRYDYEWKVRELGDPRSFPGTEYSPTIRRGEGAGKDCAEVGPISSRGVAG